jgi:hypothetical protein
VRSRSIDFAGVPQECLARGLPGGAKCLNLVGGCGLHTHHWLTILIRRGGGGKGSRGGRGRGAGEQPRGSPPPPTLFRTGCASSLVATGGPDAAQPPQSITPLLPGDKRKRSHRLRRHPQSLAPAPFARPPWHSPRAGRNCEPRPRVLDVRRLRCCLFPVAHSATPLLSNPCGQIDRVKPSRFPAPLSRRRPAPRALRLAACFSFGVWWTAVPLLESFTV